MTPDEEKEGLEMNTCFTTPLRSIVVAAFAGLLVASPAWSAEAPKAKPEAKPEAKPDAKPQPKTIVLLADDFEAADLYYQQAVITAYYAERLRLSPWTLEIPMSWLIEHAVRISGQLPADHEISQFTSLLSRAAQIKALNQ